MKVVYQRSGGIAGIRQQLEIDVRAGRLRVEDARTGGDERALTEGEREELRALLDAVEGVSTPAVQTNVADAYQLDLRLIHEGGDEVAARVGTVAVPLPRGEDQGPWGRLLGWIDARMEDALAKLSPGRNRVLGSDDLAR